MILYTNKIPLKGTGSQDFNMGMGGHNSTHDSISAIAVPSLPFGGAPQVESAPTALGISREGPLTLP